MLPFIGIIPAIFAATAGIFAAAAVATIVIYITGVITREKIKQKLKAEGIGDIIVKEIDKCTNVISAEELYRDGVSAKRNVRLYGDGITDSIRSKDIIYI